MVNTSNKNITFKGGKLTVRGRELKVGDALPNFKLTGVDMKDILPAQFAGKVLVLSIVPSLDTPVCAVQTKRFNQEIAGFGDRAAVLTVSRDLPFAQKRWCGAEGVQNVTTGSDYKYREFGEATGTEIEELGLLARAVVVADAKGIVRHVEYVPEISSEPDYGSALEVARSIA